MAMRIVATGTNTHALMALHTAPNLGYSDIYNSLTLYTLSLYLLVTL